jgi:serpin B
MRLVSRALAVAALCCLPAAALGSQPGAALADRSTAATAESAFSLALLNELGGSGNLVYSPYSIDIALTMADAGAEGRTASQIAGVLQAHSAGAAVADAAALRTSLGRAVGSGVGAPTLDIANALWTQSGLALQAPFVATLSSDFAAPPQATDFAGAPTAALKAINAWVSGHTDALIPMLLGPGSITPATAFVLANAIYLKAHWQDPFLRSRTRPAPFTTPSGQVVQVPFMNQLNANYPYGAATDYQAIDLPYSSSSLSLLAILPRGVTLAHFERGLTARALAEISRRLQVQGVDLSMPKLDLSSQESLNAPLEQLGMTDAFSSAADFRGVTTERSLYISLVEHAAVLKIDEQGTVAAGATAVVAPTLAVPVSRKPASMILNRPYLLLLRDDDSGAVLFVASVANPSQS